MFTKFNSRKSNTVDEKNPFRIKINLKEKLIVTSLFVSASVAIVISAAII